MSGLATTPRILLEKLHGAANDFLFHELTSPGPLDVPLWQAHTRRLCDRRQGLGADGVVLWQSMGKTPSAPQAEVPGDTDCLSVAVAIINADGSIAETCGNAMRCLGLLLMRHNLWAGTTPCHVVRLIPRTAPAKAPQPRETWTGLGVASQPVATLLSGFIAGTRRGRTLAPEPGDIGTPTQELLPQRAQIFVDMGTCSGSAEPYPDGKLQIASSLEALLKDLGTPEHPAVVDSLRYVQLANPHFVIILGPGAGSSCEAREEAPKPSGAVLAIIEDWLVQRGDAFKQDLHTCALAAHPDHLHRRLEADHETSSRPLRLNRTEVGDVNLGILWQGAGTSTWPHVLVVHERGAGVTAACGSGCVAAAFALGMKKHQGPSSATNPDYAAAAEWFLMPGGTLEATLAPKNFTAEWTSQHLQATPPSPAQPTAGEENIPAGTQESGLWATMGGPAVYVATISWDPASSGE